MIRFRFNGSFSARPLSDTPSDNTENLVVRLRAVNIVAGSDVALGKIVCNGGNRVLLACRAAATYIYPVLARLVQHGDEK